MIAIGTLRLPNAGALSAHIAVLIFAVLLLPLLLTPIIPSVDFYAHIMRYAILADNGLTANLAENYTPRWRLVPNLGLDIIGVLLLKFVSPLISAKILATLVVLSIFSGTLYLAWSIQQRLTILTAILAGFLVYSHIFTWGFSNFLFGLGLGLFGIGSWIRLIDRPRRQLAIAMLFGVALILVHALAFALWGLLLAGIEAGAAWRHKETRLDRLALRFVRLASVAILPVLIFFMSATASAPGGVTTSFANLSQYSDVGAVVRRVHEEIFKRADLMLRFSESLNLTVDRVIGALVWILLIFGLWNRTFRIAPELKPAIAVALLMAAFVAPNLFGSGYVNDRFPLVTMILIAAALIVDQRSSWYPRFVVSFGALLVLHIFAVSVSYYRAGRMFDDFAAQAASLGPGGTSAALYFSGVERAKLLPLCSPNLPLLFFTVGAAGPTFANPTQQPLELDGPLRAAMDTMNRDLPMKAGLAIQNEPSVPQRQFRIAQLHRMGFAKVVVCDAAGPPPSSPLIQRVAANDHWAIYVARRSSDQR